MKRRSTFQPGRMRSPYVSPWYIAWCVGMGALVTAVLVLVVTL